MRHRTNCAALATASDWIFNYMIVQITPVAISNIGWKTYMIFFVLNLFFALVVYLFYPGVYRYISWPLSPPLLPLAYISSLTASETLQKRVDVPSRRSICSIRGIMTDSSSWTRGACCCRASERRCIASMSLRLLMTRRRIRRRWRRSWRRGRYGMRRLRWRSDARARVGSL